jgi:hypothetical protein
VIWKATNRNGPFVALLTFAAEIDTFVTNRLV